jgi:hypothetical protein
LSYMIRFPLRFPEPGSGAYTRFPYYTDMRGTSLLTGVFFMRWFPEPHTRVHGTQGDKVMFPGNRGLSLSFAIAHSKGPIQRCSLREARQCSS